jgi:nucleoside-diphosphate-sugar epimerase
MENILIIGGCGYIGSRLFLYLQDIGIKVDTIDLEWYGKNVSLNNKKVDYGNIEIEHKYKAVILLAGHSSVAMCKNDRYSSFLNNVCNFIKLLDQLDSATKFIYASSSCVYGNTGNVAVQETWEQYSPKTYYDLQKQEIDHYAKLSNLEYYGLRFGTVNGWSPNIRTDIMINGMYNSVLKENKIYVSNKHIYRPILGIMDLCRAIESIIKGPDHRGIYNLASFNASVEEIANAIKQSIGDIEIVDNGITEAYNFSINTEKFKKTYNFEFKESVHSIVMSFKKWHKPSNNIRERRNV